MAIEAVSDIRRANYGAFERRLVIAVSASRDFAISDIGNILVCTAAVTLNVPVSLGSSGDLIFLRRNGAAAVITLTQSSGTMSDPYSSSAIPDHGIGCIQCESAGVWSRQG